MSLLPDKRDLKVWRRGTYRKRFTLYTGPTATSGEERDLTGYTANFRVEAVGGDDLLMSLTDVLSLAGDGLILGGAAGTLVVYISDETTTTLAFTNATYELLITSPAGETDPLLFGTLLVQGI